MRKNKVEYAVVCSTGKVRRNNEDNFYCGGHYREDVNAVCDVAYSGKVSADANELFAVFDGMGGEACGEIASYIAASRSALFVCGRDAYADYLGELCEQLNTQIREETENRSLVLMGTTAAMLQVFGEEIFVLNAGDSRIYKLSDHELRQISQEHVAHGYGGNVITKFLGMPDGYEVDPYLAKGKFRVGDVFLLCSDGVTDMLTDDEICRIIDDKMDISVLARALVDAALEKGGVDNTTAMLLRFTK